MTYNEWVVEVSKALRPFEVRLGQHYFKALSLDRPDIATKMLGKRGLDCYLVDDNLNRFLQFTKANW